jgi:hypothetical protein
MPYIAQMQQRIVRRNIAGAGREMDMVSFDFISFAAVALAVGGLAAVLWEVLAKDPHSLLEMVTDSRRFAEIPVARATVSGRRSEAAPVANLHPHAAA